MNREARRRVNQQNARRPDALTKLPRDQWPPRLYDPKRVEVWISGKYLVQVFLEDDGVVRVSVNRTVLDGKGQWKEDVTWDELQAIKRAIGRGDSYAVEIYPRDKDVVNVANMRHLWLLPEPLTIGWFSEKMG